MISNDLQLIVRWIQYIYQMMNRIMGGNCPWFWIIHTIIPQKYAKVRPHARSISFMIGAVVHIVNHVEVITVLTTVSSSSYPFHLNTSSTLIVFSTISGYTNGYLQYLHSNNSQQSTSHIAMIIVWSHSVRRSTLSITHRLSRSFRLSPYIRSRIHWFHWW